MTQTIIDMAQVQEIQPLVLALAGVELGFDEAVALHGQQPGPACFTALTKQLAKLRTFGMTEVYVALSRDSKVGQDFLLAWDELGKRRRGMQVRLHTGFQHKPLLTDGLLVTLH